MRQFFIFLAIILCYFSSAQKKEKIYGNEPPYEQADVFPQYKSGEVGFRTELYSNLNFSKIDLTKDHYTKLEFIIEKDGSMSNIKSSGDDSAFNSEVVYAVKKIKTSWKGAENEGKTVRYHVNTSVSKYVIPKGTNSAPNMFGKKKIDTQELYERVEQLPHYRGGISRFKELIASELGETVANYPFTARFVVELDGSLSAVEILGEQDDKNAKIKEVIEKHQIKWFPAMVGGRNVRFRFPVKF